MMQNVNLNAVRVFAIAARHGNFLRAAEELNISHGAVSQRIKQLELDLGVVLFDRKARGVTLTPNGARYHKAVEEALSLLTTARADLVRGSGQIKLHLGSSFASRWLMPRMKAFAIQFPDVSLSTDVHDRLLTRNLGRNEISIWPGPDMAENPAHHVRRLADLQLVAVCSPNLFRPDWPLDIETLLSFPLLQDGHRRWERLIDANGDQQRHSLLNFDRSALALDAAINGHGVAIAPTYMIGEDLDTHRLVEVWRSPQASGEYLFMSWARRHARDKHLKQTVNWVLLEFGVDVTD